MRRFRLFSILLLASATAGCDLFGPSGPGTLDVTVSGPTVLGAALVQFTAPGIQGFKGQGDTRVYGAEVNATTGVHRVIAVSPSGGTLRFGIEVEDLGAELPQPSVLKVANPNNIVVLSTQVVVEIAKQ